MLRTPVPPASVARNGVIAEQDPSIVSAIFLSIFFSFRLVRDLYNFSAVVGANEPAISMPTHI